MAREPEKSEKKQPDPSELKIALDNRAFEIQLFWQRSNYFLVLMTALGIGTFSVKDPIFSPAIALFATACSFFWLRTNLGSKFWQESWEVEVTELSKEFGVRSFEKSTSEVKEQVEKSLGHGQAVEKRSLLRIWVDKLIARKYSVTYYMILLSMVSTFIWLFVAVVFLVRAFDGSSAKDVVRELVDTGKGHQLAVPQPQPTSRTNPAAAPVIVQSPVVRAEPTSNGANAVSPSSR